MSYDFDLYFSGKRQLPNPPLLAHGQISFDGPYNVEVDDIPTSYIPLIGKKNKLYRIHLEGQINESDQPCIDSWLRNIVVESKGILFDLQSERYETPSKSGTIESSNETPSKTGAMSFYFEDGERFYAEGFNTMLATINNFFPAAMPTRYGSYEPLQGKVEQGQYAEITAAFKSETDLFMKSPTPFGHIFLTIPCQKTFENYYEKHFIRRKFLLGRVNFELRQKIFQNPAHLSALLLLFKELCVELDVVYAEILRADERDTAWFWYGLPDRETAHTICVGAAFRRSGKTFLCSVKLLASGIGFLHQIVWATSHRGLLGK